MTRLDTKTKGRSLLNETRQNACKETTLLFKWIKIHLNSANTKQKECMVREVKRTDLGTKGQRRCLKACWLVDQCCRLLQFFPPILCWRSSSEFHLCNLRASFSLLVFCTFFFPCSADFICKKWKQRPKGSPCWFMVFCFSCAFSLFFSSSVPSYVFSFSPSLVCEMDEDNGTAAGGHCFWGHWKWWPCRFSVPFLSFCWCSLWRWWGRRRWKRAMLVEFTPLPLCFSAFDSGVLLSFFLSFLSFFSLFMLFLFAFFHLLY